MRSGSDQNSSEDPEHEPDTPWISPEDAARLSAPRSDRATTYSLAFVGLTAAFMMTLVTPLIPQLPTLLNTTATDATWVLTVTLLTGAVTTPIAGRLGDLYGKRRLLLILLGLLIAGSLLAAAASTLPVMVIARALQGASMGVISLGISILRDVSHPDRLGRSVALVSATMGVGGAIGLPIAALVTEFFSWHALFVMAAALGVIGLLLVWKLVPVSTLRATGSFDIPGAIGLAIALVAILLGITKGNEWGWDAPTTLGAIGGGTLVLALWCVYELRVDSPLIDLRVFVRRSVLLTNLASVCCGFAFFASTVVLPQVLQSDSATGVGLGQTMLIASLCMMPSGVIMWVMSTPAARIIARVGGRFGLAFGLGIIAVGYVFGSIWLTEVWHAILVATAVGFGIGFAYAAMPTLIMSAVPKTETAAANSVNSVMRSLGSTAASAVVGIVLASQTVSVGAVTTPTSAAFAQALVLAAIIGVVGVGFALALPRRPRSYEDASLPA